MCGIAGIISNEAPSAVKSRVQQMCDTMAHRGPNSYGVSQMGKACLGHRRLAILDLSKAGHQPMHTADGRYSITYNGEIYNYLELKERLTQLGVRFRSNTDTEVLLYLYIEYGAKCLEYLNGMFAFAIWDHTEQQLFLARDRFGQKPLFYYNNWAGHFSFASEITALLADTSIPKTLSYEGLNHYLSLGYILSPRTMYRHIWQLEPASYMVVKDGGKNVQQSTYWDYAQCFETKSTLSENQIAEKLHEELKLAVKRRLVSDVPVGSFLSGGIDSSAIVSLMKPMMANDLHTFSVGFEQSSYNESSDAQLTANYIGSVHHALTMSAENIKTSMNGAIGAFDQLFADNSLIPMVAVSKLAAEHVTVVLSGDGADELLAGYVTYNADRYHQFAQQLPYLVKSYLSRPKKVHSEKKISLQYKLPQFFYGSLFDYRKAHYAWRLLFRPEERVAILGEQHRELIYDTDPYKEFHKHYLNVAHLDTLDQHLYVDAKTWLTDDILTKVDRASMHSSIEARCPFLDVGLATFAASIPVGYKQQGGKLKYILKKAMSDTVPNHVLVKKKSGFNTPVNRCIEKTANNEFQDFCQYVYNYKLGKF